MDRGWPAGEPRKFAELCMNQMNDPRGFKMNMPHTCTRTLYIHVNNQNTPLNELSTGNHVRRPEV